jgi:hypothetical protein
MGVNRPPSEMFFGGGFGYEVCDTDSCKVYHMGMRLLAVLGVVVILATITGEIIQWNHAGVWSSSKRW